MDDTCAVCAETLESVAYGPCGHREVCFTCIARLRFICDDRRCCLCKSESSIIFVTKALGDYTRLISDFSIFPSDPSEGKVGEYWYHEGTQAFFDDLDHYKMIKAMCRLSCIVCDNIDGNSTRRVNFRNIEHLKSHLSDRHKLFMCSLCLEGRKIFVSEQKLYTGGQLKQHIDTGDSEVDGNETERGGFMGHPMCEFCRTPFYGDNELYTHMSTEHYTCHICQRQHPGQYEYYKDYDDLEIHFRGEHFLCEDEGCLAKKFVVFTSEFEMKRHNTIEHGGHLSRSKRNAVLQIPTSFRYERSIEGDRRRRRPGSRPDFFNSQISSAIQASLETVNADVSSASSFGLLLDSDNRETVEVDSVVGSLASLTTRDSESSRQTSRNAPLEESSFPPLPVSSNSQQTRRNVSGGSRKNTIAARLRRASAVTVLHSSRAWPNTMDQRHISSRSSSLSTHTGHGSSSASASSSTSKPATGNGLAPSNHARSSQNKPDTRNGIVPHNHASSAKIRPSTTNELVSASSGSSSRNKTTANKVNYAVAPNIVNGDFPPISSTQKKSVTSSQPFPKLEDIRTSNKPSSLNLVNRDSFRSEPSNFPPVSAIQINKLGTSSSPLPKVEDVQAANKSLVERIGACLHFDEEKFSAFREISVEYRRGLIETGEYLAYVHQFSLSHLVPELAKLCPDAQKQKELLEAYNTSLVYNGSRVNSSYKNGKQKKCSKKGKEKCEDHGYSNITASVALTESMVSRVRELHSSYKPSQEEIEILPKGGYHFDKGKSKIVATDSRSQNDSESAGRVSKKTGENKKPKKTSKFHRVRLGNDSSAALLEIPSNHSVPDPLEEKSTGHKQKLPSGGVWQNGGGHKLVANFR